MKAFIDTVFEHYKNFVLILGDMGELGSDEVFYHKQVGEYINNHKYLNNNCKIITVGNLSKNITEEIDRCFSLHFNDIDDVVDYLLEEENKTSKLFLKASRSMKLEQIIDFLGENYQF
jgi:UDP-N-acetylmuramoyl-tripeptide--D-alanyl-D-alanine ligase